MTRGEISYRPNQKLQYVKLMVEGNYTNKKYKISQVPVPQPIHIKSSGFLVFKVSRTRAHLGTKNYVHLLFF